MAERTASVGDTADIERALVGLGLVPAGAPLTFSRLTGGVSSDIWKVDLPSGSVCVKRALARLRVAADWQAPVERNAYEVAWMRTAARIVPDALPAVRAASAEQGLFVMDYLPPAEYPQWKGLLRDGQAHPATAAAVGDLLVRVHAATADDADLAARFPTDAIFHSIRLEPYLLATAQRHPDRAEALRALAQVTARTKRALVHGDVSPKNILIGPHGPVFLDAECAWYGDPAFDVAFCLNHLLLKCLWNPSARDGFLEGFDALTTSYLAGVRWEPAAAIEERIARLLPGLLLARVDGKSPVEYIETEGDKEVVRRVARALLAQPVGRLAQVSDRWKEAVTR